MPRPSHTTVTGDHIGVTSAAGTKAGFAAMPMSPVWAINRSKPREMGSGTSPGARNGVPGGGTGEAGEFRTVP